MLLLAAPAYAVPPDRPIACESCDQWNQPHPAFQVFGDAWYVGPAGISSVAIETSDGVILLDGTLPQSVPKIAAGLESMGSRLADVKYVLVSHAHYDHVGGVAAIVEATHATVVASGPAADALRRGRPLPDDPQARSGRKTKFAKVEGVKVVGDGDTISLGGLVVTARRTPGHTPGGTSWSWRSCEGDRCLDLVYADSLNPVSDDDYRFSDHPDVVAALRASIATVAALPCDVLVSVHPDASDLFGRAERGELVDPGACEAYAESASAKLDKRLASEAGPREEASK